MDINVTIEDEIDKEYYKTENVIVNDEEGVNKILNYNQLIKYTKDKMLKALSKEQKDELFKLYKTDTYFKDYVNLFLKEELK